MSFLFGWIGSPLDPDAARVGGAMANALKVGARESTHLWTSAGCAIGVVSTPDEDPSVALWPLVSGEGRYRLWVAGEVFSSTTAWRSPCDLRSEEFRRELLERFIDNPVSTLRGLDGEYHIALWDTETRTLTLANDRFGGLPMYFANAADGWAFAGGVRGVLMAPGVSCTPDLDAVREAVTFGGFRLGGRTQIESVKMLRGSTLVSLVDRRAGFHRYWHWHDIPPNGERDSVAIVREMQRLWSKAIELRLAGSKRPGQTLSGGLDSRAILAEAAPRSPSWTSITYGAAGCDDARYARRAASAAGARWLFFELYGRDWLARRTAHVAATDGLIDLVDLMHLEALPLQIEQLDLHLSGFIGDAVSGPTFHDVESRDDILRQLPYYGTSLGLSGAAVVDRLDRVIADLDGAPARFALFEHKIAQSTNRWTAAWRPYLRVRKPFVDYRFFDFCQGLANDVRGPGRIHERWLLAAYPGCFARIPNQKTGVPVLASRWRARLARATRGASQRMRKLGRAAGLRVDERPRSYHLDDWFWRRPDARDRIVSTILRPGSVSCEALGRSQVTATLDAWFDRHEGAIQPIGAMYVADVYHQQLAQTLNDAAMEPAVVEVTRG